MRGDVRGKIFKAWHMADNEGGLFSAFFAYYVNGKQRCLIEPHRPDFYMPYILRGGIYNLNYTLCTPVIEGV